jgi:hypothetical protein
MTNTNVILEKYKEFNDFLNSVDLESLKKEYNRGELLALKKQLYDVKLLNLPFEIGKLTDQMKLEEYPELMGVHHYPILKELDFLNDSQQVELDTFLSKHRVGNYLNGLWSLFKLMSYKDKENVLKQIELFLTENGIVESVHYVLCPSCSSHLSSNLTNTQRAKIESALSSKTDREILDELLQFSCDECFYDLDYDVKQVPFKSSLKIIKGRNTSLDNV